MKAFSRHRIPQSGCVRKETVDICEERNWPHCDDAPRVQEKQQVKDQHSYIFVFVAFLTIPSSN